jgi:hypothetical protein
MKYLIDFNGCDDALRETLKPIGARVVSTHPLRYAAMALEAQLMSPHYHQAPSDYLRFLAEKDSLSAPQAQT